MAAVIIGYGCYNSGPQSWLRVGSIGSKFQKGEVRRQLRAKSISARDGQNQIHLHRVPKLVTPADFYKMWNIHGDDHSEPVFKVCAQSGHLWSRRKLLGECATAWLPCQKYAGQVHPIQSGYPGAAHQLRWPSPCTLAPEVPTRLYNQPDSNLGC